MQLKQTDGENICHVGELTILICKELLQTNNQRMEEPKTERGKGRKQFTTHVKKTSRLMGESVQLHLRNTDETNGYPKFSSLSNWQMKSSAE